MVLTLFFFFFPVLQLFNFIINNNICFGQIKFISGQKRKIPIGLCVIVYCCEVLHSNAITKI